MGILKNLPNVKSTIKYIPKGESGTKATIAQMSDWASKASVDPYIFSLSRQITRYSAEGDKYADAKAIHKWVIANIKYKEDVDNVETLIYPVTLVKKIKVGDCDCQSVLVASLLISIGIPARFVVAKDTNNDNWQHVFTEANINGNWVGVDTTDRLHQFGYKYNGIRKNFEISTNNVINLRENNGDTLFVSQDPTWLQLAQKSTKFLYSIRSMLDRGDITENDLVRAQEAIIDIIPSENEGSLKPKIIKKIPAYAGWWKKSKIVFDVISTPQFKLVFWMLLIVSVGYGVAKYTGKTKIGERNENIV